MATKYDHVDRTGDQPAGVETLNRLGNKAKDLQAELLKRHNRYSGAHYTPEIARAGGYVEIKNDVPLLHQVFGEVYGVSRLGEGRYRIHTIGRMGGLYSQMKVTPVGGYAVPMTMVGHEDGIHDVSLYDGTTSMVDRSFVFQIWHQGQIKEPNIMPWTDRAVDRVWGASTSNAIAADLQKFFDLCGARHNTGTGVTEDPVVAVCGGYVSQSAGTYTLREKYGFVDTITGIGTGNIRINLSSNMQADGSDYWYRPLITSMVDRTVNYVESLIAGQFTVRLREVTTTAGNDTAKDGQFAFHIFGVAA